MSGFHRAATRRSTASRYTRRARQATTAMASVAVTASAPALETSANSSSGSEKVSKAKPYAGTGVEIALLLAERLPAHRPHGREPVPAIHRDGAHIRGNDAGRRANVLHFAPPGDARADTAFVAVVVVHAESLGARRRRALRLAVEDAIEHAVVAEVALEACIEHARIVVRVLAVTRAAGHEPALAELPRGRRESGIFRQHVVGGAVARLDLGREMLGERVVIAGRDLAIAEIEALGLPDEAVERLPPGQIVRGFEIDALPVRL